MLLYATRLELPTAKPDFMRVKAHRNGICVNAFGLKAIRIRNRRIQPYWIENEDYWNLKKHTMRKILLKKKKLFYKGFFLFL